VRNLPIKAISEGASNSGIPPQGASIPCKPVEAENLKQVASKGGRVHLEKIKLSGSFRRKLDYNDDHVDWVRLMFPKCGPQCAYGSSHRRYMTMEDHGEMISVGENSDSSIRAPWHLYQQ
jgi:hypothetical protein